METKLHEFQISILRELLFMPHARFRDLNKVDVTNDHFTFHLKQLIKSGLVTKENGTYSLTEIGKEFANRIDTNELKIEKQAKLAIAIHAVRNTNKEVEYLVHKRLKEPFYGWFGSHSGKIKWGETPLECAQREFYEETGLTGTFTHKGIVHYLHLHQNGRLLEDKYFWVFRVDNVHGDFKEKVEEGENTWMTEGEYRKLTNTFATFDEVIAVIDAKKLVYIDRIKTVHTY